MSAHPAHDWEKIMPALARRYARGETLKAIADSLGVCQETVIAQRGKHLAAWLEAYEAERPPIVAKPVIGPTLDTLLLRYFAARDLMPTTQDTYRHVCSTLQKWHGGQISVEDFTVDLVNRFLLHKQQEGREWMYRRSLRSHFRALLRFAGKSYENLRPVRWEGLHPVAWTPEEVQKLMDAAPDETWRTRIAMAYYSGLSPCDLARVERRHIDGHVLTFRRSKTKRLVKVKLPAWLVKRLPEQGRVCGWDCTEEWTRRVFNRIVKKAGLTGTLKKLRKSSGTQVEKLHPGAGHMHLGNTRTVFERHYLDGEQGITPLSPPDLPQFALMG